KDTRRRGVEDSLKRAGRGCERIAHKRRSDAGNDLSGAGGNGGGAPCGCAQARHPRGGEGGSDRSLAELLDSRAAHDCGGHAYSRRAFGTTGRPVVRYSIVSQRRFWKGSSLAPSSAVRSIDPGRAQIVDIRGHGAEEATGPAGYAGRTSPANLNSC